MSIDKTNSLKINNNFITYDAIVLQKRIKI